MVGRVREEDDACGRGVHTFAGTAEPQSQQCGEVAFRSPLGHDGPSGFELYNAALVLTVLLSSCHRSCLRATTSPYCATDTMPPVSTTQP